MRDFDPAQLGHIVPRGVRNGVEVKDSCEELGGKKGDGEEGVATHEQRPKEVPGGFYFLLDRRKRRSTRSEVVNDGSELIHLTFGSSKGIRRYVFLSIAHRITSVSVITDVWDETSHLSQGEWTTLSPSENGLTDCGTNTVARCWLRPTRLIRSSLLRVARSDMSNTVTF